MEETVNIKGVIATILGIISIACIFSVCYSSADKNVWPGCGLICAIIGLIVGCRARRNAKTVSTFMGVLINAVVLGVCAIGVIANLV